MNVNDLIICLQKFPKDFEVYAMCDHGQQPELITHKPSLVYMNPEYPDEWFSTEEEDCLDTDWKKVILL